MDMGKSCIGDLSVTFNGPLYKLPGQNSRSVLLKDRQLLIRPILVRAQYIDHLDLPPSDSYT